LGRVSKKCRGRRPGGAEGVDDLSTGEDEKWKMWKKKLGRGKGKVVVVMMMVKQRVTSELELFERKYNYDVASHTPRKLHDDYIRAHEVRST